MNPAPGSNINGEPSGLAVDRAIGELRRGRAIMIVDGRGGFVFAPVETMPSALLKRLLADRRAPRLILTAERARAGGLATGATGPVSAAIADASHLDALRSLAGIAAGSAAPPPLAFERWPGDEAPVLAAFGLAKAARLIPAIVGFATDSAGDDSLLCVSLPAILEYASAPRTGMQLVSEARVPLAGSETSRIALFRDDYGGSEHVAVIIGKPDLSGSVPVRLHSACLTGDLLASLRCDCGEQLKSAVDRIAGLGGGILLYLDQEGRSIGLANKLRAYAIQDTGVDTYDADRRLGFSSDERSYDVAAAMLQQLGVTHVRLLTNNPRKIDALREHGIDVDDRIPLIAEPNEHNAAYLRSKRERAGHLSD
jgi:GTP cyclohydrolase II